MSLYKKMTEAWWASDVSAMADIYHPGATLTNPPLSRIWTKDEYLAVLKHVWENPNNPRPVLKCLHECSQTMVVQSSIRLQDGSQWTSVSVHQISDGKISNSSIVVTSKEASEDYVSRI